jgi:hypothetical protein
MRKGEGILGNWDATSEEIRQAMGEAIYAAMRKHKEKGVEAITWRDGRIIVVSPEEIEIPDENEATGDAGGNGANGGS